MEDAAKNIAKKFPSIDPRYTKGSTRLKNPIKVIDASKIKEGDAVYIWKDQRIHKVPTAKEHMEWIRNPQKLEKIIAAVIILLLLFWVAISYN